MTITIVCLMCGGDKWSGKLPGGLHCSACNSPMEAAPQPEVPCTSGTFSNGTSKIGYLLSEVAEIESHFYPWSTGMITHNVPQIGCLVISAADIYGVEGTDKSITLHPDGRVTFGKDLKPDEAAQVFLDVMEKSWWFRARIRQPAVTKLVAYILDESNHYVTDQDNGSVDPGGYRSNEFSEMLKAARVEVEVNERVRP